MNLLRSSKSVTKQLARNKQLLQSSSSYLNSVQLLINNSPDHHDCMAHHDDLYSKLDRFEKELNVPDILKLNTKYYIVGVATRIQLLKQLLEQLLLQST